MRIAVLVNDALELGDRQTTTMLVEKATARGHEAFVAGVTELALTAADEIVADARRAPAGGCGDPAALAEAVRAVQPQTVDLASCDLLWIRTNPGRDPDRGWAHETALAFAHLAQRRGVVVLNDPTGLLHAGSKLYLETLPAAFRPRTFVSHDPAALIRFLQALDGPGVLKPLRGSRGTDVYRIDPAHPDNLHQIVEVVRRSGYGMAQSFVPEARGGDVRLVLMEGRPLVRDGHYAAVARIPSGTDFRSNVAVGGRPAEATIDEAMLATAEAVGPALRDDGIFLAGLDIIGGKVVEINVYSTGGLFDAERFSGVDFCGMIVDRVEALVGDRRGARTA